MESEKTITFKRLVEAGGAKYESITLREPTGDEIARFFKESEKNGNWEGGMALVALVANVDMQVIRRAPASNVQEAIEYCVNFLGDGQPTGASSAPS
jgi:hypothetical protein